MELNCPIFQDQAITSTYVTFPSIKHFGINSSEIQIKVNQFSNDKIQLRSSIYVVEPHTTSMVPSVNNMIIILCIPGFASFS